jgi:hypothetical protein
MHAPRSSTNSNSISPSSLRHRATAGSHLPALADRAADALKPALLGHEAVGNEILLDSK